ncbi:MAG: hypothetical protein IPM55_24150 [Acidobacteria bacterium]|nr:hypothetical protein [Acidobacteriota bacterium]
MYTITGGATNILSDTASFLAILEYLPDDLKDFFSEEREIVVTRAPGRLDLMGGIADYSGSLVLQLPIASAAHVALQKRADNLIRIVSLAEDERRSPRTFEFSLDEFLFHGSPIEYQAARSRFNRHERDHWAAYAAGSFLGAHARNQNVFR